MTPKYMIYGLQNMLQIPKNALTKTTKQGPSTIDHYALAMPFSRCIEFSNESSPVTVVLKQKLSI